MTGKPVVIHKHAILKHHYRRALNATPGFHQLDGPGQWAVLRKEVEKDKRPESAALLAIMDSRAGRRDEVLSALEQARRNQLA